MTYLFAAFIVIWAGLFSCILYWQHQVRDLKAEVEALRAVASKTPSP
jgi:CcmD family protein